MGGYIVNSLIATINEVGAKNVVQVVLDNEANCKNARQQVQEQLLHITSIACVAHGFGIGRYGQVGLGVL